ncbi:unnamed protein product [Aureobasidium vineae]|uniref:BTB domain-containing protein n=1 Tax=Aureobasidium vineae TaxID=2773715 RepID=A0A9N8PB73_9PEZI|nr:unnamed protein product [Aureobasidium vineae]
MLRFFYDGTYHPSEFDDTSADQHLIMHRLADFYDASALRKAASHHLINFIDTCFMSWKNDSQSGSLDHVIRSIQQILGPSSDEFADNSIQEDVFKFIIIINAGHLYKNELSQELLVDGSLLNESLSRRFAQKTGEVIMCLS